jgi:hypothetical protein
MAKVGFHGYGIGDIAYHIACAMCEEIHVEEGMKKVVHTELRSDECGTYAETMTYQDSKGRRFIIEVRLDRPEPSRMTAYGRPAPQDLPDGPLE